MSRILNGDKIIDSVRKRTMTPDDTSIFTDSDILDIVNEELDVQVLQKLLTLHEDHLTIYIDVPRNEEGEYDIPYRAIGNKVRDIHLISGDITYELSQISLGELPDYSYSIDSNSYLDRFYVESNKIKLVNSTRPYNFVRFYFYVRPNVLTKMEEAGIISAIIDNGDDTVTLTLSQVGRNFTNSVSYDIVGARTPNKIKSFDLIPVDNGVVTGTTGSVTFNKSDMEDILTEIKVGDYITLAEQTPVPNIPTEMHPILAQAAAIHLLEALGDTEALNNAQRRMEMMSTSVQSLVDDRVELAPKKIKPRHGTLAQSLGMIRKNRGRY